MGVKPRHRLPFVAAAAPHNMRQAQAVACRVQRPGPRLYNPGLTAAH